MTEKFARNLKRWPWEHALNREVLCYPEIKENDRKSGRVAGNVLEIGPGQGYLLLSQAKTKPDNKYVAIEYGKKRYYKLIDRIQKLGIDNIQLLQGLAQAVVPGYIAPETFDRVYVLFPDPWPKVRQSHHRLLTADFMSVLACIIKPDKDLIIATDHPGYADWIVSNGEAVPALERLGDPYCTAEEIPDYIPTYFELKWREEGRSIFYLRYRKRNMPVAAKF